jgi:hypothetical protein
MVAPRATDRCLVPVQEIDPKFVVQAPVMDERMIVPPAVVGRAMTSRPLGPRR